MKKLVPLFLAATVCAASSAQAAGHAHVHGVAKLDVALERTRIVLQLSSPLDNLLAFERAPRSDSERRQADAVVSRLREADLLFRPDPAARCTLAGVTLSSSALKLGTPDPAEEEEGHADIDGTFEFTCVDATRAAYVDVGLFEFSRLQRLEVQVATPRGQFRRDLTRPASRIVLAR